VTSAVPPAHTQQPAGAVRYTEPGATARQTGGSTYWFGVGLGVGTSQSTTDAFGLSANLPTRSDAHLLSLRGVVVGELFGDDFWDIGLLYGRATGNETSSPRGARTSSSPASRRGAPTLLVARHRSCTKAGSFRCSGAAP
jgi:hypothetical protein